ncbi:hypothetical protein CPB84DRAFT_186441 [Gymnopilus junonius]|uniref:Uncharacterized protein n=1 Tax=Gymnopilus junonius TaxID=109634 RepID=A0A9P5NDD7_GYMJU|nr:hypothetical protein CPB84DRAFT_186441 [Gymnopilus junonius]
MDDPHNQSESTAIHLSKSLNTSSPAFPPELEREIFEFAAYGFIECISTLVLVAKKVKEWVEPIRYNIIIATALNRRLRKWMPLYEGRSPFILPKPLSLIKL